MRPEFVISFRHRSLRESQNGHYHFLDQSGILVVTVLTTAETRRDCGNRSGVSEYDTILPGYIDISGSNALRDTGAGPPPSDITRHCSTFMLILPDPGRAPRCRSCRQNRVGSAQYRQPNWCRYCGTQMRRRYNSSPPVSLATTLEPTLIERSPEPIPSDAIPNVYREPRAFAHADLNTTSAEVNALPIPKPPVVGDA